VKHVVFGSGANILTFLIMNFLMTQRGLKEEEFTSKPVYCGVHWVNTFQGLKSRIIVQIQCRYVPFIMGVHFMAHGTNLVIQTFSNLSLVSHIEVHLQFVNVFSHDPKRHLQFIKLKKIVEIKGNIILQNTKTRWMSMVSPIKHVLPKYCIFLMKMAVDAPTIAPT
jgi:hypothetical protein